MFRRRDVFGFLLAGLAFYEFEQIEIVSGELDGQDSQESANRGLEHLLGVVAADSLHDQRGHGCGAVAGLGDLSAGPQMTRLGHDEAAIFADGVPEFRVSTPSQHDIRCVTGKNPQAPRDLLLNAAPCSCRYLLSVLHLHLLADHSGDPVLVQSETLEPQLHLRTTEIIRCPDSSVNEV